LFFLSCNKLFKCVTIITEMRTDFMNQTQTTTSKNPHRNRNIGIAVVIIAIVAVAALYVGGVFTGGISPLNPFDFSVNVNPQGGTIMQGGNLQTSVSLALLRGSPEQITLSTSGGPDGVTCVFSPQTGTPDCTSTLTINVPESVPTDAYSLTVTATGGGKTYSSTYTLSVLSAKVTVSGTVTTTGFGTHPTGIKFVGVSSGLTFETTTVDNSYIVNLPNQQTYRVTCSWAGLLWSSGTFDGGTLTVNAGVGTTTMTQNFAG
jgi:hypothetical protein